MTPVSIGDEPLVVLRGVSFSYPLPGGGSRPALRDVTFSVARGEAVVVLGAGGAGKSTLAALLAGVACPGSGEVTRAPAAASDGSPTLPAGLVTQNPEDSFSSPLVREEMGVVLENLDREPASIDRAVDAMLAEIGLADHAASHPNRLSGGQKQLLAVASVLIAEPPLILLDEPLTLLDAGGRGEVERLLARLRTGGGAEVFFSSELEDADRGERVVVLHEGAVVWEGASADLPRDGATLAPWGLLPPDPPCSAPSPFQGEGQGEGRASTSPSIIIRDLHFTYDRGTPGARTVLRGVDLEAHPGEVLGVVGAIGSGKTTLLLHLNGLLLPQRGSVSVAGRTLAPGTKLDRLLHRELGMVLQFPEKQLFAESISEDVAAGLEFAGVDELQIPARVRTALERVGLEPAAYGERAPFALTWGEKRLAAIAGVLVLDTPAVAFDEPGAGLDPAGRRRIGALLADLAHREGRTVIIVSHHLVELGRIADRIAVLHEGRIVSCDSPGRLWGSGPPGCRGLQHSGAETRPA